MNNKKQNEEKKKKKRVMPISDRAIGNLLHLGTSAFLVYYLIWVVGTPFVDDDHPFQNFFPPKEYGVAFPAVVLGLIFTSLTTVAFWCMYGVQPPKEDLKLYEKYSKKSDNVADKSTNNKNNNNSVKNAAARKGKKKSQVVG